MKKLVQAITVFLAATALASSACAQQGGGGGSAARSACRDDAKKFCSDVQPGGGRIINCLEDHSKEVSDACYDVLQKFEDRKKHGGDDSSGSGDDKGEDSKPSN